MTPTSSAALQDLDVTVGFSTLADRVDRLAALPAPPVPAVVVIQDGDEGTMKPADAPAGVRAWAEVDVLHSLGVAKSRNRAMDLAGTRYVLFGDDDVEVVPIGFHALEVERSVGIHVLGQVPRLLVALRMLKRGLQHCSNIAIA